MPVPQAVALVRVTRHCATVAQDSGTKIDRIGILATGSPVDWVELDGLVHQFKGSSASLGAETITRLCIKLREMCQAQNQLACVHLQQEILQAYRCDGDQCAHASLVSMGLCCAFHISPPPCSPVQQTHANT